MRDTHSSSIARRRFGARVMSLCAVPITLATVALGASPASAYWHAAGIGSGVAATGTLAAPVDVVVPEESTGEVLVSWSAGPGTVQPLGHFVTRDDGSAVAAACGSSPTVLLTGDACTDTAVPDGTYTYVVTSVFRSWTAASRTSTAVTVVNEHPLLGAAGSYSVLAATAVVNVGTSWISGDVGVSPGIAITGLTPTMVGGDIHPGDASAAAAHAALVDAYAELSALPADEELTGNLGGRALTSGVYHFGAAMAVTGTLTLDAEGDTGAVFILQSDAAFNTAAASVVALEGGALASNVYWVVDAAAGTGANSFLAGTILASGAITLGASTELIGRALSLDAATLGAVTVRFTAALPPEIAIDGGAAAVTKDTTPAVSGTSTAAAGRRVTATVGGQALSTTVGADGHWSVEAAALVAGAYDVVARVRDADGNGNAAVQVLTVEVNPEPVDLGVASTYSVLGRFSIVNVGVTSLSGDLGLSPGSVITGFPPGTLAGATHAGDAAAATAQAALLAALGDAASRPLHTRLVGDLGGRTFHMGVHHANAALALTGTVTLDAEGDPDAIFIFQTDAAFNTAAASRVVLTGGAQASNVYWVVTGAAGTGANSFLAGTILAGGAITLGAATELTGQALSRDVVTLAADTLLGVAPAPFARQAEPPSQDDPAPQDGLLLPTPIPSPAPTPQATS